MPPYAVLCAKTKANPPQSRRVQPAGQIPMRPINDELKAFLNLTTHPARFNKEQTAAYLGFEPDQITSQSSPFFTPANCCSLQ